MRKVVLKDRNQNVVLIHAQTLEDACALQDLINKKSKNRIAAWIKDSSASSTLLIIHVCSCERLASLIERIAHEKGILCRREFKQQGAVLSV